MIFTSITYILSALALGFCAFVPVLWPFLPVILALLVLCEISQSVSKTVRS